MRSKGNFTKNYFKEKHLIWVHCSQLTILICNLGSLRQFFQNRKTVMRFFFQRSHCAFIRVHRFIRELQHCRLISNQYVREHVTTSGGQQINLQDKSIPQHLWFKCGWIYKLPSASNPVSIYQISSSMHEHAAGLYETFLDLCQCPDLIGHWLTSSNSTLLCIRFVPFPSSVIEMISCRKPFHISI